MNRMTTTVFGLALIVLLCGTASAAETIYVPGDYATIQSAVDNATAGDTIYVWNGTYTENVNIGTSHLTLAGEGADVVTVTEESTLDSVFEVTAERVNISGFTVTGTTSSGAGIYLDNANHCNILENNCSENYYGIRLAYSNDNALTANNCSDNNYGIYLWYSRSNTLQGNTMSGNRYNFCVDGYALSHYIQNIGTSNTVNGRPIYYWVDQQDREIPDDAGFVGVVDSTNITVRDLVLTENYQGVLFAYTGDSRIENVTTRDNMYGIWLHFSSNNTLRANNALDNNLYGIWLHESSDNTLQENTVSGNRYNFCVGGYALSHYTQNIDTSNTVDGKPIYYWVGQQDREIPDDAGFVGVVDSTNITVKNLVLTENYQGVLFAYTDDSRIENVTASENGHGIHLTYSTNNTLTANNILKNYYGIRLRESSGNDITCNLVCNNRRGLYLRSGSTENTISHNNIVENGNHNETSGGWAWQFYNDQPDDVVLGDNWWGTSDEASIAAGIYDWNCDSGMGNVTYLACLDAPSPCAPGTEGEPVGFTTADALIALEIAAGSRPCDSRWDVSGDGVVTSLDALMILKAASGAINIWHSNDTTIHRHTCNLVKSW